MKLNLAWVVAGATAVVVACAATETTIPSPGDDAGTNTPLPGTDGSVSEPSTPEGGSSGSSGSSSGDIVLPVCGDGKKAASEQCDDGNNADGDGCSKNCTTESAGPNDVCPGVVIALTGTGADTRKGTVSGSTATIYGQTAGSCGGATGKDAVYSVTSDVTGLLTAKLTSTFDSILYARRTCDDTKTESACNDAAGSAGGETIKVPVTKDQPVFLYVDGYSGSTGTFTLDVEVATAFCGNGVAEAPEACDDGNTLAGDGCAPDCSFEAGGIVADCPGQSVMVTGTGNAPRKISFAGSTSTADTGLSPSGCSGAGKNTVYSIASDVDGSMRVKLLPTYDDATLHIRSECDNSTTQLSCAEATAPLQSLELAVPVRAGFPTYVIVDSDDDDVDGPYTLDVTITPGACGNKALDGVEECDDGNAQSGDGCTAECKLEPVPAAADTCPGVALQLTAAAAGSYTGVITSSTVSMTNDYKPKKSQNGCSTSNFGKDSVYVVTSPIDGFATATVSGTFGVLLYARDACDADAAAFEDLACADAVDGNGAETIGFPIKANTPTYVIVDGESSSATASGLFELGVVVTPSVCGNDVLEGGEECDDANTANGDGCSSTCKLEPATSHDTCANAEAIDPILQADGSYTANLNSGTTNLEHNQSFSGCGSTGADAIFTLKAPIDGVVSVDVPVAGFNVALGARTACPTSTSSSSPGQLTCSNATSDDGGESIMFGVTKDETYYVIVDGNGAAEKGAFTMLLNVRPPGCGDGLLSGNEQCDDGNTANGDGCSSTCTLEALAGLDTCPGYTLPLSGSGNGPWTGVLTVDTSTLIGNYAGTCGGSSKEGVVVVTPPISGRLTARLSGDKYHSVIYARTTCGDASTEPLNGTSTSAKACDDDGPNGTTVAREINFKVTAGTPYYLFVDGFGFSTGIGRLNITVTP